MTANTKLIHAIADALIDEYGEEATGWLEDGGRANVERILGEWRTAIEEGRWIERVEDVLVLRALRHETHWVEVLGGPDAEALIRDLVDEDWCARARGRLEDVASKAVESARVSDRWRVAPGEPIFVRRIRYDLDEWSDLPVPEGCRVDPFRESG